MKAEVHMLDESAVPACTHKGDDFASCVCGCDECGRIECICCLACGGICRENDQGVHDRDEYGERVDSEYLNFKEDF